jgi:hypothetical protein
LKVFLHPSYTATMNDESGTINQRAAILTTT